MEPAIMVKGLINQFGDNRIHDELDLEVRRGEIFSIVGGSGSGKSVLLRSMLGLQQPRSGEITVLGMPIRPGSRVPHQNWGVLFQHGALFSGLTVRENVELPIALHSKMAPEVRAKLASLKIQIDGYRQIKILKQRGGRQSRTIPLPLDESLSTGPDVWASIESSDTLQHHWDFRPSA